MAFDASTDRRIQRMSCQKVAVEAMGPFPVTSKGEPAAAAEGWKKIFVGLCDFLDADVKAAGNEVASVPEPATVSDNGNVVSLTLDQAMRLTEKVKAASEGNEELKNAMKLQFVKFGLKPTDKEDPLGSVINQLTKPQADELVELLNKEV